MPWDPAQYRRFTAGRKRPAVELAARIECDDPLLVVDLGCGTGEITELLAARWPHADVVGVDSSPEMLAPARARDSLVTWVEGNIATWRSDRPIDVLYANASLHWLDDHPALFPRLVAMLAPGGTLAVQMPHNHSAPSHTVAIEVAADGPWSPALLPLLRPAPVAEPADYHDLLAPVVTHVDIWETEYLHVLDGDDPVVAWTQGSLLRPLLAALDEPAAAADFLAEYAARLRLHYPPRDDGTTLFRFRRLFVVAST